MRGILTVALVAVAVMAGGLRSGMTAQDDPRLDRLFAALESATGATEAQRIEHRIWALWSESGRPEIDRLLESGSRAMALGDHGQALVAFNAVIELAPEFAEGWNKRATLYYLMGEDDKSIDDIGSTLALEPRHFGALSGLALIYLRRNEDEKALVALERAVAIHPFMPHAEARLRSLRARLGEPV